MEKTITIGIYKDSTGLYTDAECDFDNICYIELPEKVVREWYKKNKDVFDETSSAETGKAVKECCFEDWREVYTCDDTEGLFQFAVSSGAEPLICSTINREDEIILPDGTTVYVNSEWTVEQIYQIAESGGDALTYDEALKDPRLPIKLVKAALEKKPRSRIRTNGSMAHVRAIVDGCMPEIRHEERKEVLKEVFASIKTILYEMGEGALNSYFGTTEIGIVLNQDPEQVINGAAKFRDDKNRAKVQDLVSEIGFQNLYRIVCDMAGDYCTLKKSAEV